MRSLRCAVLLLTFITACQSPQASITIVDNGNVKTIISTQRTPIDLLASTGITLGPYDRLLYQGAPVALDEPLPITSGSVFTVSRAVEITLHSPEGTRAITTSAASVGQMLIEDGVQVLSSDRVDPPISTPLVAGLSVTWQPSVDLAISLDGSQIITKSSAFSVGAALAESGISLIGLDFSIPSDNSPLPQNGSIQVVRVVENISLVQRSIPYSSRSELTADLELDQQEIVQVGQQGLAISRVRVRTEDGDESLRQTDDETIIRPPQDRILGYGTKVVVRTAIVDGASIDYWRVLTVYATSYSPCRSGVASCYYGTSSGLPVKKGVAAVVSRWYPFMVGTEVYVPGYGRATVADIGGGFPDRYWIDLAYSDDDFITWGDWVSIYFLTPVPDNIQYILPYR